MEKPGQWDVDEELIEIKEYVLKKKKKEKKEKKEKEQRELEDSVLLFGVLIPFCILGLWIYMCFILKSQNFDISNIQIIISILIFMIFIITFEVLYYYKVIKNKIIYESFNSIFIVLNIFIVFYLLICTDMYILTLVIYLFYFPFISFSLFIYAETGESGKIISTIYLGIAAFSICLCFLSICALLTMFIYLIIETIINMYSKYC